MNVRQKIGTVLFAPDVRFGFTGAGKTARLTGAGRPAGKFSGELLPGTGTAYILMREGK